MNLQPASMGAAGARVSLLKDAFLTRLRPISRLRQRSEQNRCWRARRATGRLHPAQITGTSRRATDLIGRLFCRRLCDVRRIQAVRVSSSRSARASSSSTNRAGNRSEMIEWAATVPSTSASFIHPLQTASAPTKAGEPFNSSIWNANSTALAIGRVLTSTLLKNTDTRHALRDYKQGCTACRRSSHNIAK
jgi:hypothetical protein